MTHSHWQMPSAATDSCADSKSQERTGLSRKITGASRIKDQKATQVKKGQPQHLGLVSRIAHYVIGVMSQ